MKVRLSNRLSPKAKAALLQASAEDRLRVLVRVSSAARLDATARSLEALGALVTSRSADTRLIGASVPSRSLAAVAEIHDVTYVDAAAFAVDA